jgi:hypothetical protein
MMEKPNAEDVARMAQECEIRANLMDLSGHSKDAPPFRKVAEACRELYEILAPVNPPPD